VLRPDIVRIWLQRMGTTMVQCAWAAVRKSDCKFGALFHRLTPRRGARASISL